MLPEEMKATYEKLGIPEAERKFLAGVTAQYECEVVYHKNRDDLAEQGVLFTDMDTALARLPRDRAQALRHGHPAGRQQVRRAQLGGVVGWLVHLRAAGRARRHAAAGVLPHQRGERGPVRADADHRRRGRVGALRRGLLGADLHRRLAALRGGGARSPSRARASGTRRSRTGRRTSTTWSRSGPRPRPRRPSSGSTATSGRSSR